MSVKTDWPGSLKHVHQQTRVAMEPYRGATRRYPMLPDATGPYRALQLSPRFADVARQAPGSAPHFTRPLSSVYLFHCGYSINTHSNPGTGG